MEKASRATKWDHGTFPGPKYFRSQHGPFPEQLVKRTEKNLKQTAKLQSNSNEHSIN